MGCGGCVRPETTLGELLEEHPEVEAALKAMAPSLAALDNPAMRSVLLGTVTLDRLAQSEHLALPEVLGRVREAAGVGSPFTVIEGSDRPDWADPAKAAVTLDARPILQQGGHPVGRVLSEVVTLKAGEVYQLVTPFEPTPLIERVTELGFEAACVEDPPGVVRSFFRRQK